MSVLVPTYADVLVVLLYGSSARGDNDSSSDKDICVFIREDDVLRENEIRQAIANHLHATTEDVVVYSENQLEAMLEYGSLFLWHLKLEGKVIFGEDYFYGVIRALRPYERHREELLYHRGLPKDVILSIHKFGIANELDLSQLFTVVRNTCMILAHKNGYNAFGRTNVFRFAKMACPDLPLSQEDYQYLASWKMQFERGKDHQSPLPSNEIVKSLIKRVSEVLGYALRTDV